MDIWLRVDNLSLILSLSVLVNLNNGSSLKSSVLLSVSVNGYTDTLSFSYRSEASGMSRFHLKTFYFFSIWVETRPTLETKLHERRFFRSSEWSKEVCFNERIKTCMMQLRLCL